MENILPTLSVSYRTNLASKMVDQRESIASEVEMQVPCLPIYHPQKYNRCSSSESTNKTSFLKCHVQELRV